MPARAQTQVTSGAKMPIGVVGSGHIGGTVGALWVKAGHPVLFSSRHPEQLTEAVRIAAGLVRDAGFDPVEVGRLADARRFQGSRLCSTLPSDSASRCGPGYGQAVSAVELRRILSLAP